MSTPQRNALVLDAGIGYRLFVPHAEQEILHSALTAKLQAGFRFYAPTLWRYEVTSVLSRAVHAGILRKGEAQEGLALACSFPIDLIPPSPEIAQSALVWTSKLQRAAAYDSFYLALAEHLQCEFWTCDKRLTNAVALPWIRFWGLSD
jgi:predicted nucleic acid-binding protein